MCVCVHALVCVCVRERASERVLGRGGNFELPGLQKCTLCDFQGRLGIFASRLALAAVQS
jgi:hypothetical protein